LLTALLVQTIYIVGPGNFVRFAIWIDTIYVPHQFI